ncbi:MAG: hypothetical protein CMH27_06605 [Micavibrio sp.]|nr:hypothetical protein [Micavibrio sp.]
MFDVSIWFYLWGLLSAGLLFFSAWTFLILFQQKKAWRHFAKKNKLRYRNSAFMSSPQVNGVYNGYTVGIFTSEHETERGGTMRKMTAIEVEMDSRMPIDGAIGSGGMVKVVQALNFSEELSPSYDFWSTEYIIRSQDKRVLERYLTEKRAHALVDLMKKKNIWVIFIFKGQETVLRIDTPSPFENEKKLTQTIDMMIEVAKILEIEKGESASLTSIKMRKDASGARVDVDDEELEFIGLELEEDEAHMQPDIDRDAVSDAVVPNKQQKASGVAANKGGAKAKPKSKAKPKVAAKKTGKPAPKSKSVKTKKDSKGQS